MSVEEDIAALKEATRAAHESIQASREERQRLETAKGEIRQLVELLARDTLLPELDQATDVIMEYQRSVEEKLSQRFDKLIEGPVNDLEELLRELHRVHKTADIEQMGPLPDNPLFKRPTTQERTVQVTIRPR